MYNNDIMKPFIHTDFQLAVCHATSKCGIFTKSHTTILPLTSFQIANGISKSFELNTLEPITSFNHTVCLLEFGTSIPTTPNPGIGACILIDLACRARAKSFFRFSILCNFTHSFGASLYCITVGHTLYHSILTSILNCNNFSSISISFLLISFSSYFILPHLFDNRFSSGNCQFLNSGFLIICASTSCALSSSSSSSSLLNNHHSIDVSFFSIFIFFGF
ncbi:MAG: hypothetical protein Q8S84_03800 [bacterium]|nr:hypothetical protein [bacterium]MDP3380644.1 hypothetical protein [bacterium]